MDSVELNIFIKTEYLLSTCSLTLLFCRTLTTPTEDVWPGVTSLPDYKPTFPNWKENTLSQCIRNMDDKGIDLLKVCNLYNFVTLRRTFLSVLCFLFV